MLSNEWYRELKKSTKQSKTSRAGRRQQKIRSDTLRLREMENDYQTIIAFKSA